MDIPIEYFIIGGIILIIFSAGWLQEKYEESGLDFTWVKKLFTKDDTYRGGDL